MHVPAKGADMLLLFLHIDFSLSKMAATLATLAVLYT